MYMTAEIENLPWHQSYFDSKSQAFKRLEDKIRNKVCDTITNLSQFVRQRYFILSVNDLRNIFWEASNILRV